MMQRLRWGKLFSKSREANGQPRSPLPSPHTNWPVGRCFAICGHHGSLSNCHEWMSLRCWTLGSAADAVLATWPVLVARNGYTDAEDDEQLWAMHPTWRHSWQSPSVTYHCYCTFGVATCWLYQYWDNDGVGSTPKHGEPFGLFDHFMKHVIVYVTPSQTLKMLLSFCGKDILQSSEHQPSSWVTDGPTLKETSSESFVSLWAYRNLGLHLTMLKKMDRWNELTKCWCTW